MGQPEHVFRHVAAAAVDTCAICGEVEQTAKMVTIDAGEAKESGLDIGSLVCQECYDGWMDAQEEAR